MSNLVQTSVRLRNELQHTNWTIEELQRLYCKTIINTQLFHYSTECSTDFGCPLRRKCARKKYFV